ncbi:LOW QUALITY PROTEIN: hypothetical protein GQ55_7G217500 [Panicum hallii var. hallii]|uniref:DUF834 domain-containing protein n=1 Tax=Panicum hallii var. hallii TaxID=1504633 RepID=A0A2T7CXL9_9POAL|nr:LOW QUALITY PROTEIN: hypothetical protein GQ55_7G217500 [Panicum hallii var. hallii]
MEKEDGDNVGQVKWEGDGKSSRRPVRRERERFKGVKARREVGHASTSRSGHAEMDGLGGLGLKTTMEAGFPVWASKPGADSVRPSVRDGGHVATSRSLLRGGGKS